LEDEGVMSETDYTHAFLGRGWAFPVCLKRGEVATAQFDEDIRQSIRIILGTNPPERRMRPDFGAGLVTFVFEPVNVTTMSLIETRVRESLIDWEPRIDVEDVRVTSDEEQPNLLLIDVHYRVRATNTRANLVYPFYLEEGASS
jgi:phage baseplate assembly protein W